MDRKFAAILISTIAALAALPARAAFENVMVSPRARAMGDASVAVPDAPFASNLNPAGLAVAPAGGAVGLSYVQPYGLDFNRLYFLGGAHRLPGGAGSLGFGFRQFKVEYEDVDLQTESTFSFSHGLYLYQDLHSSVAAGYGLSVYRLEFGETVTGFDPGDDTVVGVDVGLMATLHDRTQIGVLVHNLNAPKIGQDEEEIPQRLHAGVAYAPYPGVTTTFELETLQDEPVQWHGGLELEVVTGFALRAGVVTEPNKLTAGFGYSLRGWALNYGFSTGGGVLDTTHQFGVTAAWGGDTK
ncbi:MAG TPA: hypothetical protein PLL30_10105 [Candidatus Krumholzibacteria bacterium]|nr:hypothetical protein [Candidatus Krumholzibacteria bacterium]HPD72113.1 hypothetical protein [Candidatus Krumholzibacteria bacterium]HRY40955.1 hypothetical protein [Candidatus Krumholzibacteria bacterium]